MLGRVLQAIRLRFATLRALRGARAHSREVLRRANIQRVLVLCYGNIYRSPFVAQLLRDTTTCEVRSAGFHPKEGRASPDTHVSMSAGLGVQLAGHRSARVKAEDIEWADIVVLMDRHNWARLHVMGAPESKVVWLGALLDGAVEIEDPYGLPEEKIREILDRLRMATFALRGVGHTQG